MLRSLALVSAMVCLASAAHAQTFDTTQYKGVQSNEVVAKPDVQTLIRGALGAHDTAIADGFFARGVDMPAELGFSNMLILHACKAHDCSVNEVKIAIQQDGRVYADMLIDGKIKHFGDIDNVVARTAVRLP